MNTDRLYEFLILSRTLNYSKAAEHLYISQSVLSKHIQDLERELDAVLFSRTTHGVALTESGRILADRAQGLIDRCNRTAALLQISNLPVQGEIRIACALEMTQASHIQIFISRFADRYPNIHMDFEVKTEGLSEDILHGDEYDLIFSPCEYPNPGDGIQSRLIASHSTCAALGPGHRLLMKSLLQLRDLEGENILVPFSHEYFGPYAQNWLLAQRHTHNRVTCTPVPNLSTALFLVAVGKGIAIIPGYARAFTAGSTHTVGISDTACRFSEYLYCNLRRKNGAAELFYAEFCSACPSL